VNPRTWFYDLNIFIFPTHDKVPAVAKGTSQFDFRCTRDQASRFKEYGVPLGLFGVADSDSPETEAWVAAHLPPTPFQVRTARGLHRYYRLVWDAPHFFHRDTHTIEFRHRGQYVVGPGSVRPNGAAYMAAPWSWNINDVPFFPKDFLFDDGSCGQFAANSTDDAEGYEFPDAVHGGRRHWELHRLLRSWKGSGFSMEEAREIVHLANENRCYPPLAEDAKFEKWFVRQWNKPDRPFPTRSEIPALPLEPATPEIDLDLDAPGEDI
jgi:hypothetical protein